MQAVENRIPEEGRQTGEEGDAEIAPVADRRRRDGADQHVAGNATGVARGEGQYEHPEEIEPALDRRRSAAQREHEGPDEIERQQQRMAVSDHGLFDKSVDFLGGHAIVGANLPLAKRASDPCDGAARCGDCGR
jgi:hypothetical protein